MRKGQHAYLHQTQTPEYICWAIRFHDAFHIGVIRAATDSFEHKSVNNGRSCEEFETKIETW